MAFSLLKNHHASKEQLCLALLTKEAPQPETQSGRGAALRP
jgi:hypothetical protein